MNLIVRTGVTMLATFAVMIGQVRADPGSLAVAGHSVAGHSAATGYSAAGLYNLANSYVRDGKPGLAVLNYERASLLAAYDPDVEANLRFVRKSAKLPAPTPNRFERAARIASPDALAWAGFFGLVMAAGAFLAGQLSSRYRWMRRIGVACGLALVGLPIANAAALWATLHSAVVITNATPARVSPVPMGDSLFVLSEAETVRITARHEDFYLVRSRTGQIGWVARANVVPIAPRP